MDFFQTLQRQRATKKAAQTKAAEAKKVAAAPVAQPVEPLTPAQVTTNDIIQEREQQSQAQEPVQPVIQQAEPTVNPFQEQQQPVSPAPVQQAPAKIEPSEAAQRAISMTGKPKMLRLNSILNRRFGK